MCMHMCACVCSFGVCVYAFGVCVCMCVHVMFTHGV